MPKPTALPKSEPGEPDLLRPHYAWQRHGFELAVFGGGIFLIVLLWLVVKLWGQYPSFILPHPLEVLRELKEIAANGLLWIHIRATLSEMLSGLVLGLGAATLLGYIFAKSPLLERLMGPYIVASQSIPVVAIAPLLIIWFGTGKMSKVLICALIVFFPILINTIVGIRSVDQGLKTLMRSLNASRWQTFTKLEIPAALPVLLGGLKIGVTLSAIGAVVGEFVGADRGLGYLINLSKGLFNTSLMFAALIALTCISMGLYLFVSVLEKWLLDWRN